MRIVIGEFKQESNTFRWSSSPTTTLTLLRLLRKVDRPLFPLDTDFDYASKPTEMFVVGQHRMVRLKNLWRSETRELC